MSGEPGTHEAAQAALGNQPSFEEMVRAVVEASRADTWTSLPVIVTKRSEDGHTISVKAAVKIPRRTDDNTIVYDELPEFQDIPINFSGGGGVVNTHPTKLGDEGWIDFSTRDHGVWRQQGSVQQPQDGQVNGLASGRFRPGARSDPRKIPDYNTEASESRTDDGRHRTITHPANGVKVTVNGGKQTLDVNAATGALEAVSKTLTLKSGTPTPGAPVNVADTVSRDLNEQLKGLAARVAQTEHHIAGVFDATSQMRAIAQTAIPGLAVLAPILNQNPAGLKMAADAIEGRAQAYLQVQVQQALAKFLSPNLAGLASLLPGNVEGLIQALTARIADLIARNPVLAAIDDLQRQADAILTRGASPEATAALLKPIRDEIARLTQASPAVGLLGDLSAQLQGLASQAGPGLNFLGPQQRLVQGVVKSLHLSET